MIFSQKANFYEYHMKNKDKTKEELINELASMRKRIAMLAKCEIELNRTNQVLRKTEERYRTFFETSKDCIFITSKDGKWIDTNQAAVDFFAYETTDELLKTKLSQLFESSEEWENFTQIIDKQGFGKNLPINLRKKDGNIINALCTVTVKKSENGNIIGYQGTIRDITEIKKMQESLQKSESQKKAILDASIDKIRLVDKDMRIIWANKTTAEELNMTPENLVGQFCYKLFVCRDIPCDDIDCPTKKALHSGEMEHAVLHRNKLEGISDEKYWESYAVPIKDELGDIINLIQVTRNITERKKAEEELRSSREQLRNLSAYLQSAREQERTNIAREIHDELGQTLTAFKMDLSWLDRRLIKDRKLLLDKINSMSKVVTVTIRAVQRISTELRPGLLDDLGLIAAIEWQSEEFQNRTGIKCEVTLGPDDIILDQDRSTAIFRIFQETLTNVARHADATNVKVSLKKENEKLVLKVNDNGKGIKERQIFDSKSFGLMGMRERAFIFGGKVDIKGTTIEGTTVTATISLEKNGSTLRN